MGVQICVPLVESLLAPRLHVNVFKEMVTDRDQVREHAVFGLVVPAEQPRCIKSALWGASRSFTAPERLLVIATAPTVSAAAKAAKARVRPLLTARASSSDRRRRSADFALCKLRSICATRFACPLRDCISQTHAVLCLRSRSLGHDHNSGAVA